ncbi:hypothetical protein ASF41_17355 [Methylobacterium sp. Leaf111]|nr:hypothetical protein ASF41_17355 [Methylobacterium sp. Leaf111]
MAADALLISCICTLPCWRVCHGAVAIGDAVLLAPDRSLVRVSSLVLQTVLMHPLPDTLPPLGPTFGPSLCGTFLTAERLSIHCRYNGQQPQGCKSDSSVAHDR